jgi:hypothetical protein
MEIVTITMPREQYEILLDSGALPDHTLKEIYVKDELFENDEMHKALKKASIRAYKAMREYEFNKRNNIVKK